MPGCAACLRTISCNLIESAFGEATEQRADADLPGVPYDQAMASGDFFDDSFLAAIPLAGARARTETLRAGVPVFYWDSRRNLDVMEEPSGRKYEIRFLSGAPRNRNYEVVRELDETTA